MKKIHVTCCATCPLFAQTTAGFLTALLGKEPAMVMGQCNYPHGTIQHLPMGSVGEDANKLRDERQARMKIHDASKLPVTCPLVQGDVLVTLTLHN